jgi:ribosomal-protein-alanine N-acetyltransferase
VNIRRANPDDLPAVLALERACPTAAHWSPSEYELIFASGATPRMLLVAEESTIVGFIMVRTLGREWEIENVAVVHEARGRGIGHALVDAVFREADFRHPESIFLEVRASNAAARALYVHAGFTEVSHRRGYYANPDEDAVLCRLHLRDGPSLAP